MQTTRHKLYLFIALYSALPQYNKEDVDKDIDGVKGWIDKTKDEL